MQLLDFPELVRLRRAKLRPKTLLLLGLGTGMVLGGLLFFLYLGMMADNRNTVQEMLKVYFIVNLLILLIVNGLYALSLAAQSIAQEREQNTYDFQRLAAAGPWRLALGKLLGAPCEAWFILLCALPFLMISVIGGGVSGSVLLQCLAGLVVFQLFISSLGLACSALVARSQQSLGLAIVMVGVIHSVLGALGGGSGVNLWNAALPWVPAYRLLGDTRFGLYSGAGLSFFGLNALPPILGFLAVNLLLAIFFLVIAVRRLTDEELPLLSVRQAMVVFLVFEVLLVGSLPCSFAAGWMQRFHAANLALLAALAFLMMPTSEQLRSRMYRGRRDEHWRILFERPQSLEDSPPLLAFGGLCFAYVLFGGLVTVLEGGQSLFWAAPTLLMVAGFGLAVCALLTVLQLYFSKSGLKAGALLLVLALGLPPIALAITGEERLIMWVNPVGYLIEQAQMVEHIPMPIQHVGAVYSGPAVSLWACPAICMVLAVMLSLLAAMRLRFLLDMREEERRKEAA